MAMEMRTLSSILPVDQKMMNTMQHTRAQIDNEQQQKNEQDASVEMHNKTSPLRTNVKFVYHDKLDDYYVTVINSQTDETIKEIPPKKFLDMYVEMADLMGLFVDRKT